jgi:heme A synthase
MYTIAKDKKRDVPTHVWRYGLAALAMVYLQIVLGGMVSSNGAALACEGFPLCSGQWWPGFEGLVGIQFLHRIGAVGALVIVSAFIYQIKSKKALPDEKNKAPLFMGLVILTQWGLGIGNVLFNLPFWMSIAHLAVAQLLFALVLSTTYEIRHHQLHQTH